MAIVRNLIDQPMLLIDSPRPTAGQFVLKRLWTSSALERRPLNLSDELDDAKRLLAIAFDPPGKVFERVGVKLQASLGLPSGSSRPFAISPP